MNLEPWSEPKQGDNFRAVTGLQYLLRANGHDVVPDGDFGPLTEAAVKSFQAGKGLSPAGIVSPDTWRQLVVPTRRGSTGEAVRGVQSFGLAASLAIEEPLVVDGDFGPQTEQRVINFQGSWGLTPDGIAGQESWSFLASDGEVWPLVKPGSNSETNFRVRPVQYLLRAHGSGIPVTGNYDAATGEAVRQFQMDHRAMFIGDIVGQLDWPDLVVRVQLGSHGDAVKGLQDMFVDLGQDGVFGPLTEQAVRNFQEMFGLAVDGIAGRETWHALVVPKAE